MNIFTAAGLADFGQFQNETKRTRREIKAGVEKEFQPLMISERFFKVTLSTNKLASPIRAASRGPIIADVNKAELGKLRNGFVPKVIVISGQRTFQKAHIIQASHVEVWLGENAAKALGIDIEKPQVEILAHCTVMSKDGEPDMEMAAAHRAFRRAVKRGYTPKIEAKSPPGWEKTVERMKENHPEVENPFALAHWMDQQGYHPKEK